MSLNQSRNCVWMLGLLLALGGCCHERVYRCDSGSCGTLSGRGGDRGGACHICNRPAGCCVGHPFMALKEAIHCKGCGDCYWDEWYSDPPDECDPCDDCGSYIGARCCPPKRFKGVYAHLKGGRHCEPGCTESCCHGAADSMYDEAADYETTDYEYAAEATMPLAPIQGRPAPKKGAPKQPAKKSTPATTKPAREPVVEESDLPAEEPLPAPRSSIDPLPNEPATDGDSFRPTPADAPREPSALEPEARKPSSPTGKSVSHKRVAYFDDFDLDAPPVHANKFRMGKK